ncbi:ATP-binding protein [Actinomadura sp. DC4]|uniref:ATP-binding protein n=1 Tax=Actinomadura sp. DC4 TaxID=3055069 RepID=UPI0025B1F4D3|nr:ATP-binding protein [Actinomadura sp. DC4]MDN3354875.1 ATP-binding protein [Actinomadura sp. DC4]
MLAGDGPPGAAEDLLAALARLDRLIEAAVARTEESDPGRAADRFRGLYVGPEDVTRLLAQPPATSPVLDSAPAEAAPPADPLRRLRDTFGLSGFDLDLLVLALAPEIDLRYERIFGFLHDDLGKRRPTVELALDLLCGLPAEKFRRRSHLAAGAPLLRHGLLTLDAGDASPRPPFLARQLVPDEHLAGFLLGEPGLDPRLDGAAVLTTPDGELPPELLPAVTAPLDPPRVYLHGPAGGRRAAAEALAAAWGRPLLNVDLNRTDSADTLVRLAVREAALRDAVLGLTSFEAAGDVGSAARHRVLATLAGHPGPVVMAGATEWVPEHETPLAVVSVAVDVPAAPVRRRLWQEAAERAGVALPAEARDALAARFRLGAEQIAAVVRAVPAGSESLYQVLAEAARSQAGTSLGRLAQRVPCRHEWSDLVLPAGELAQLHDLADSVDRRETVLDTWGFARHAQAGGGITALFSGPSGTGKTLAAGLIARRLGYDLYRVDLARVVSKYIGETEKNLDAVFTAARDAGVVLLFDEADALFGKRSAVQDAHDRYANLEVAYLLQKMEEFDGVAVLATNLRDNLDPAFMRRLTFVVSFPFPDVASRRSIWQRLWPEAAPLAGDVDLDALATELMLPGGHLRNIALAAAHMAAGRGDTIGMADVLAAARREYAKLGKMPPALLDGDAITLPAMERGAVS